MQVRVCQATALPDQAPEGEGLREHVCPLHAAIPQLVHRGYDVSLPLRKTWFVLDILDY